MLHRLGPRQAEAALIGTLWWYAASVLYPAKALPRGRIRIVGSPSARRRPGCRERDLDATSQTAAEFDGRTHP
jgi:hypothetical protein